jgi:hypothetical protein
MTACGIRDAGCGIHSVFRRQSSADSFASWHITVRDEVWSVIQILGPTYWHGFVHALFAGATRLEPRPPMADISNLYRTALGGLPVRLRRKPPGEPVDNSPRMV